MAAPPKLAAMSADFFTAFAKLPKPQQRGVRRLISRFNADASAPGLNFEPIRSARDPGMRSLRIDQDYRAIIHKPAQGNTYVLLWADKHDSAYDWAEARACQVHPDTGAFQIFEPQSGPGEATPAAGAGSGRAAPGGAAAGRTTADGAAPAGAGPGRAAAGGGAFDALRDRQLARLGIPAAMLADVRAVGDDADLDVLKPRLPDEAYEALFYFLAGDSYEAIVRQRDAPTAIDPTDLEAALARDESRARFVVIENDAALEAMLNAPLERWRVFLHPSQRRLVERTWNGPVRVLGGAGTGKTVAALHRARWLARTLPAGGRILLTTFTRNLAADLEQQLRAICTPDEAARIDVTNLHRWVAGFLRGRRYPFTVIYNRDAASWQLAMERKPDAPDLPDRFYRDEWELVVQPRRVTTEDAYCRAPRAGRGIRLSRTQRRAVWPVFEEYRAQLAERRLKEGDDACDDAAALLADEAQAAHRYAAVVVDETQDLGPSVCALLRALVREGPNDLFIVGDGHQRIFGRMRVVLSRCGIDIRGRSRKLRLNYRTTEQTRRWAARLLDGCEIDDLDGGRDDNRGITSVTRGPEPRIEHAATRAEQAEALIRYLTASRDAGVPLRNICVTARTKAECDALTAELKAGGLQVHRLRQAADNPERDGVRVATMHRVKGLEFDRVVIASANEGLIPLSKAVVGDSDAERIETDTAERALVYVAATRAKQELRILTVGAPSPYLPPAP